MSVASKVRERLFESEHPAPLGVLRLLYGVTMVVQMLRLREYLLEVLPQSSYMVSYPLLRWLELLPQPLIECLWWLTLVSSSLVALGVLARSAAAVTCIGWSYFFLVCQGHYNNHYYLLSLIAILLVFTDAAEWGSVRHLLGATPRAVPRWQGEMFRLQLLIVYFYGGLAKFDPDWLAGRPLELWFGHRADAPLVGPLLAHPFTALAFSWGGLAFDLLVGFALYGRRTRWWALPPLLLFHVTNHYLWNIGVFPWFMIGATVIFFRRSPAPGSRAATSVMASPRRSVVLAGLGVYFAVQLLVPLRHHLYPGHTPWHGQGELFAWRMMLSDRVGALRLEVSLPGEGVIGAVDVREYVNDRQFRALCKTPVAICNFSHFVAEEMRRNAGLEGAQIRAVVWRQLNGREHQKAIDDSVDLAAEACPALMPAPWVTSFVDTPYKSTPNQLTEEEARRMGL